MQAESNETQTAIADFRAEVKSEADETQALFDAKTPALVEGREAVETVEKFSFLNGTTAQVIDGDYGPRQIVFFRGAVPIQSLILEYDDRGNLVLVTPQFWTPALLDTRAIWLDASDSASIAASGGYVTRWASQLDPEWDARPFDIGFASDSRPKTGVATINGLNAISFDNVDDDLFTYKNGVRRALADVAQGVTYPAETAFFVGRRNAPATSHWLSPGAGGNRSFTPFVTKVGANVMALNVSPVVIEYNNYPPAFPSVALFSFSVDSSAPRSEMRVNGVEVASTTSPVTLTAGRQDGIGGTATAGGSGDDLGEVLVLREVPDELTRQKIEGYLAHKWGLAGELPSNHPYKMAPPGV